MGIPSRQMPRYFLILLALSQTVAGQVQRTRQMQRWTTKRRRRRRRGFLLVAELQLIL